MKTIQSMPIYISHQDKRRLENIIDQLKRDRMNRDDLTPLVTKLDQAITVESQEIPRDVVTMNSHAAIVDMDTLERRTFTLVFPQDADVEKNMISVLTPNGSGMLGHRVGDVFKLRGPDGMRKFIIARVIYQPEARDRSIQNTHLYQITSIQLKTIEDQPLPRSRITIDDTSDLFRVVSFSFRGIQPNHLIASQTGGLVNRSGLEDVELRMTK